MAKIKEFVSKTHYHFPPTMERIFKNNVVTVPEMGFLLR